MKNCQHKKIPSKSPTEVLKLEISAWFDETLPSLLWMFSVLVLMSFLKSFTVLLKSSKVLFRSMILFSANSSLSKTRVDVVFKLKSFRVWFRFWTSFSFLIIRAEFSLTIIFRLLTLLVIVLLTSVISFSFPIILVKDIYVLGLLLFYLIYLTLFILST